MFETVSAQFYKHYMKMVKSVGDLAWVVLYPLVGLLSVGLLGLYLNIQGAALDPLLYIIVGVIVWNFYALVQRGITYGLTFDVWDQCLKHAFLGNATEDDFVWGNASFGLVSALIGVFIVALVAYLIFGFNILAAGWVFGVALISVFFFAVSIGLIVDSLMLTKGYEYVSLIWVTTGMIMIFSGVYYPIEILPGYLQVFSNMIPVTHAITAIRGVLGLGGADIMLNLGKAIGISLVYFLGSYMYFKRAMKKARETGMLATF